jgi:hypothetical protein
MDAPANAAAAAITASAIWGLSLYQMTMGSEQPTATEPTELQVANERAKEAEGRVAQ